MVNIDGFPKEVGSQKIIYEDNLRWPKINDGKIFFPTEDLETVEMIPNKQQIIAVYGHSIFHPSEMVNTEVGQHRESEYTEQYNSIYLAGDEDGLAILASVDCKALPSWNDTRVRAFYLKDLKELYKHITRDIDSAVVASSEQKTFHFLHYAKLPFNLEQLRLIRLFDRSNHAVLEKKVVNHGPYTINGLYSAEADKIIVNDTTITFTNVDEELRLEGLHQIVFPNLIFR